MTLYIDKETIKPWGYHLLMNLYDCHKNVVNDKDFIENYVIELCDLINVKRFGECTIIHFGDDPDIAGFSMIQFIETSLISGHFVDSTRNVFLDVFSCKNFSSDNVISFTKDAFCPRTYDMKLIERGSNVINKG
jgi:S-adenosylmethionine decarboxylase